MVVLLILAMIPLGYLIVAIIRDEFRKPKWED